MKICLFLFTALFLLAPDSVLSAQQVHETVVDGRFFQRGTSTPLRDSTLSVKFQILDPSKTCILYEELQVIDTWSSDGAFNLKIGSSPRVLAGDPSKRTSDDSNYSMERIYNNTLNSFPATAICPSGYSPLPGHPRYLRLTLTPTATGAPEILTPDILLGSVPVAHVAESLAGIGREDVLTRNETAPNNLSQNTLQSVFNTTRLPALLDIIDGTSSKYVKQATNGAATVPPSAGAPTTPAAGQMWYDTTAGKLMFRDSGGDKEVGVAESGVLSVAAGTGLNVGAGPGGTITSTGTLNIDVGTTAGKIVQVQTGGKLPALDGTDLTALNGTAIQSGTIGGTTAINTTGTIQSGAITSSGSLTGTDVRINSVKIYKPSTANYVELVAPASLSAVRTFTLPDALGTTGQVLQAVDNAGTLGWTTPVSGTVTSVGLSLPSEITVTNSPVTSSGTLTGTWASQTARNVFAAPTGGNGTPSFRQLNILDIYSTVGGLSFLNTTPACTAGKALSYISGTDRIECVDVVTSSTVTTALGYTPVNRAGDTMTGALNLPANGLVVGTNQLIVSGTNVGIGTATPGDKLHVEGKVRATHVCAADGTNCKDLTTSWTAGSVTNIATGTGLTGGPITSTGTISIATGGVSATELASNAVTTIKINNLAVTDAKINDVAWSKITSKPTTVSGYGITDAVSNAGSTPSIAAGADASKPAFGTAGRLYVATDTNMIYRDTGAAWAVVGTTSASDLSSGTLPTARLPALTGDVTSSAGSNSITLNTVPITKGGTGQTTPNAALNALLPTQATHSGKVLQTDGTNTSWVAASTGTVTSVATGTGLTGGTITSTGTISLASIASNTMLANATGGAAAPTATTLTSLIDSSIGSTRGSVLYRGAAGWSALTPGTSGQFLRTSGAGADPVWASENAGTVTSVGVSVPAYMTSSGGPVTTSGTIALSYNSQSARQVFASPTGASGAPTFRSLNILDIFSTIGGLSFLNTTPGCTAGRALSYISGTDRMECVDVVTSSTISTALGYAPANGGSYVAKAGDTMTGRLGLSSSGLHVSSKDDLTTRTDSGFFQTSSATTGEGWPTTTNGWYHLMSSTHSNDANYYAMQFAGQFDNQNELYYRATAGNGAGAWNRMWHSGNLTNLNQLTNGPGYLTAINSGMVTTALGYTPVNRAGDTMTGNLAFSAANPTITSGGSYITIPNGLYVSGGTPYFQTQIQARGGIANDGAATLQIDGGTSGFTNFPGQVGIGTATPGDKLHVEGKIRATHICATNGTNCKDLTTSWSGSTSASDLTSGTLPAGRLPAFTGDVTSVAGSNSITLNTVPISKGGTGQTTPSAALNALLPSQATHSGKVLQTDGTNASWVSAGGSGTVTSVGLSMPGIFSVTNSPVTASGTLTATLASQSARTVLAAPTGGAGTPSFRSLNIADVVSTVSGPWFNVSGACPSGQMLQYSSGTDTVSCTAYSLTSSQVTTALGYTPANGTNYVAKAGDTMTGTLNLASNGLVVGTNQLVVSGGNVGVGTATPGSKLDVNGGASVGSTYEGTAAYANSSTAYTIPDTTLNIRRINLTGNATITLPAFASPSSRVYTVTVFLKQDATGSRTVSYAGNGADTIKWDSGSTPTIASAANKVTILQFTKASDETVWYASMVWKEN